MTQEPQSLLERQVNEIVHAVLAGEPLPEEHADCGRCGHPYPHHDGFGCAAVSAGVRCPCEKYQSSVVERGLTSDAGDGWFD